MAYTRPSLLFFIIYCSFSQVLSTCLKESDSGTIECIRGYPYSFWVAQYGLCVRPETLRKMPEMRRCHKDSKVCWLPCMYQLYQKEKGEISDICKCKDKKKNRSFLSSIRCYLGINHPKYFCDWMVNCFEKKSTCHGVRKKVMPFYDEYCKNDALKLSIQGENWLQNFIYCVQKFLVPFIDSKECQKAEKDIISEYAQCIDGTKFCSFMSSQDKDLVYSHVLRPYIKYILDHENVKKVLECYLGKTDSIKLFRYYFMDPLIKSMTHREVVQKFSSELYLAKLETLSWKAKVQSDYFEVIVLNDAGTHSKDLKDMKESLNHTFAEWPILLNKDGILNRIHSVRDCSSVACNENDEIISVDFQNYVCNKDELTDTKQLLYVHENAWSVDCCAGSKGGQCVALAKCQCQVPWTKCWVPQRKVIENCSSVKEGTVIATFDLPDKLYGNNENDKSKPVSHTAIFISCNKDTGEVKAHGQSCGHGVETQTFKTWSHRFYEVASVNAACRSPSLIAKDCRKRYKDIKGEKTSIKCDASVLSNLNDGTISKVTSNGRSSCSCQKKKDGQEEEKMIGCLCNAPASTSWIPGKKISSSCEDISPGTVLASFENGDANVIFKPDGSHIAGIMKSCKGDSVEIYTQNCITDGIVLHKITATNAIWNHLYEIACDTNAGRCGKYWGYSCNI